MIKNLMKVFYGNEIMKSGYPRPMMAVLYKKTENNEKFYKEVKTNGLEIKLDIFGDPAVINHPRFKGMEINGDLIFRRIKENE